MGITPTLAAMQEKGFPMGGEPSVAIDLIDTLMKAVDPNVDLLEEGAESWWHLEAGRLPDSARPEPVATRRLRAALRELFEAHLDQRPAAHGAVDDLNFFAESVPSSPRLTIENGSPALVTRWHPEHGGNPTLAAIAREGMALLVDPKRSAQLRRCANDACSMIFLAENSRRVWCAPNVCGNRARVARHYQRQHED